MGWEIGQYCPFNITLTEVWVNHGFSPCLMTTVNSLISLAFMLIFATIQFRFYRKYATSLQFFELPLSQLFGLQMVLQGVMPVIALVRFLLEWTVLQPGIIFGYMLLPLISSIITWPISSALVLKERHFMLPSVARKGHGLVLLIFWTWTFATENLNFLNLEGTDYFFHLDSSSDIVRFVLFVFEYLVTGGIFILGLQAPGIPSIRNSESFARLHTVEDEVGSHETDNTDHRGIIRSSPFQNLWKKLKMIAPFVWPRKNLKLQLYVIISFSMLVIGRVTNIFVPIYSKKIVDSMTISTNSSTSYGTNYYSLGLAAFHLTFRWDYILIFVSLKVVQGGGGGTSGIVNIIRSLLWISVEQYTTRETEVHFFKHLHKLSLRWHLGRKTGEVLRAMDRGTESINNILNYLVFSIIPTVADIIIAIVYLSLFFNWYFGVIVFVTMVAYLISTFVITEWRTKFRRTMNQADNEQKQRAIDSLLNFETVKYYSNEKFEAKRFESAIIRYQKEEWKVTASICLLNLVQLFLINIGLLCGSLLCMKMVVYNEGLTVGDYVLFTSYLLQLYGPLNFFGTYYRLLQKCFIDMENMLELFKEDSEIKDADDADDLVLQNGSIEFRNVSFSYIAGKEVLKDVSFTVPGGKSVALVGNSGGGKSSICRLIFRFYDPTSGEILIDGQNISKVTQKSLRKAIGVVPQDTVLFNDTVKSNIKYGRTDAEDEEIYDAAKAACIHDRVITFAQGYATEVGERGLKLSGGEKQRVAIARTLLKNPTIILLDEATSALDTNTERQIQKSLQELCQERTSLIVAHRLSTIINVNQILVLDDGKIAEAGTHTELLARNGMYANLWNEQLKSSNNVEDLNENTDELGAGGGDDTSVQPEEKSLKPPINTVAVNGGGGGHNVPT